MLKSEVFEKALQEVVAQTEISRERILSQETCVEVVDARHILMYIMHSLGFLSPSDSGAHELHSVQRPQGARTVSRPRFLQSHHGTAPRRYFLAHIPRSFVSVATRAKLSHNHIVT